MQGELFLSSCLLVVSLNDSSGIKVCNAFAIPVKKNTSTIEDIAKETLCGLTFAIRNGSVCMPFQE